MSYNSIIGENNKPPSFTIDDYKFDVQNILYDNINYNLAHNL